MYYALYCPLATEGLLPPPRGILYAMFFFKKTYHLMSFLNPVGPLAVGAFDWVLQRVKYFIPHFFFFFFFLKKQKYEMWLIK